MLLVLNNFLSWFWYKIFNTDTFCLTDTDTSKMNRYFLIPIVWNIISFYTCSRLLYHEPVKVVLVLVLFVTFGRLFSLLDTKVARSNLAFAYCFGGRLGISYCSSFCFTAS